jgi:hypothetical protein
VSIWPLALWSKIIGKPWSIMTAVAKLNLDIIGLPSARLAPGFVLPGSPHWRSVTRGGPHFASIAVFWKINGQWNFELQEDLTWDLIGGS